MTQPFSVLEPRGRPSPILISVPHCGTDIPSDIASTMVPEVSRALDDTDWLVHELYRFGPELGIAMIHARYSRYVIDLNRDPESRPLYQDGRSETSLVPLKTFAGQRLYAGNEPDQCEVERRLARYYRPYHDRVADLLSNLQEEFDHVVLLEAHSIRRHVSSIRAEPFPDIILGDQKGATAESRLITTALKALESGSFDVAHNDPFMGGYITRHFANPSRGIHTLQVEMCQDLYMDEEKRELSPTKLKRIQPLLRQMFLDLKGTLEAMV